MKPVIEAMIGQITKLVTYAYPDEYELRKIVKIGGNIFDVISDSNFQIVPIGLTIAVQQHLDSVLIRGGESVGEPVLRGPTPTANVPRTGEAAATDQRRLLLS